MLTQRGSDGSHFIPSIRFRFLQHDCDSFVTWPDFDLADRVSLEFEFTERLVEPKPTGYRIFAGRAKRIYKGKPGRIGGAALLRRRAPR